VRVRKRVRVRVRVSSVCDEAACEVLEVLLEALPAAEGDEWVGELAVHVVQRHVHLSRQKVRPRVLRRPLVVHDEARDGFGRRGGRRAYLIRLDRRRATH